MSTGTKSHRGLIRVPSFVMDWALLYFLVVGAANFAATSAHSWLIGGLVGVVSLVALLLFRPWWQRRYMSPVSAADSAKPGNAAGTVEYEVPLVPTRTLVISSSMEYVSRLRLCAYAAGVLMMTAATVIDAVHY